MITNPLTHIQMAPVARQKEVLALCLLVLCTLGLSLSASAQNSTFIIFDPPGAIGTAPTGINSAGAITGSYSDANYAQHGFIRARDGSFITFDVPGATLYIPPLGINPAGEIAGNYYDAGFTEHGFLRARDGVFTSFDNTLLTSINPSGAITGLNGTHGFVRDHNGTFTTLDVPGSIFTIPEGINPAGEITGFYYDASGVGHGFLRARQGTFTTFDPPGAISITPLPAGAAYTTPVGINQAGEIAGYYSDSGGNYSMHGFVRSRNGTFTIIDAPGSAGFTKALGIGGAGTTMGIYYDDNGGQHAFVYSRNGTFITFDPPGSYTNPTSINTPEAITGDYNGHGFLRTPDNN